MVHIPVRGELPARLGPSVQAVPGYGPSVMDAHVYRDPTRYELERERVLGRHWMLAGRSAQVKEAGDWITYEGHDECIVVVRQSDDSLAAFHNVCRHRGPAIIAEKTGCGARRFSCPYHGWVYDTKGKLVGIPEREDFGPDHVNDIGAIEVAVGEWGGWVWINLAGPDKAAELQRRIMAMLAAEKRQDSSADAVLKLDPLVLAGAQADPLPGRLRQQFGPEAHLAVTGDPAGGSVFVLAARAGQENSISDAVAARIASAAATRLSGSKPGIVSIFIEDMDRAEWRSLRDELALEGAVRRFLAGHAARRVVAAACSSRAELFGLAPPDAVPGGELRFRNPAHPAAKSSALAPAITSTS